MAANREMEEPNINVSDSVPALCASLPAPVPAARPADGSDPKASGRSCDRRSSSAASPERPDPATRASGAKRPREATRCSGSGCRKRVGLIGFRCRCGYVFCSEHRYSDRHDCSYDYKAVGREAIARENPVVRAAKLLKV